MTSESAQDTTSGEDVQATAVDAAADGQAPGTVTAPGNGAAAGRRLAAAKPRAGVPVWRTGKPDAFLAAAVGVAREAVQTIAKPAEIGEHLGAKSEGERVVTHLFESRLPGYGGWQWFAVVTRNSRSKVVTVSELGLLPSDDSILAPEWVPWAKRVRPEDETPLVEETTDEISEESVQAAEDEAVQAESDEDDDDESDEPDTAFEDVEAAPQGQQN